SVLVLDRHPRPEVHAPALLGRRLDDREAVELLRQVADAAVDLAELLLAVDVLGVLAAIALRRRDRDLLGDPGALHLPEALHLELDGPVALLRDVARPARSGLVLLL